MEGLNKAISDLVHEARLLTFLPTFEPVMAISRFVTNGRPSGFATGDPELTLTLLNLAIFSCVHESFAFSRRH